MHLKDARQLLFKVKKKFFLLARHLDILKEKYLRRNWPAKGSVNTGTKKVIGVVVVNYNTKVLISYLLFSISKCSLENIDLRIVVVDNNSIDGSKELLQEIGQANLITLISNKNQRYHGPSINQAIKYLCNLSRKTIAVDYIWILDSDVIILKRNTLRDALNFIMEHNAAIIGQFQYDHSDIGDPHVSSILIDPSKVWKRNITPFVNQGMPSGYFYASLRRRNMAILNYPFHENNYTLHLGTGTLNAIKEIKDQNNKYYNWALSNYAHHFHGNDKGYLLYKKYTEYFSLCVNNLTAENLIKSMRSEPDLDFESFIGNLI